MVGCRLDHDVGDVAGRTPSRSHARGLVGKGRGFRPADREHGRRQAARDAVEKRGRRGACRVEPQSCVQRRGQERLAGRRRRSVRQGPRSGPRSKLRAAQSVIASSNARWAPAECPATTTLRASVRCGKEDRHDPAHGLRQLRYGHVGAERIVDHRHAEAGRHEGCCHEAELSLVARLPVARVEVGEEAPARRRPGKGRSVAADAGRRRGRGRDAGRRRPRPPHAHRRPAVVADSD